MQEKDNDKILLDNGIIQTFIEGDNPSGLRWEQKKKVKYTFSNGEEIILSFGPFCMIDEIDNFLNRRNEIIINTLKRLKLEKIVKNINR